MASYYEGCISERCFTISRSNETKNFNDAKTWCNDRKSSLAIVNDGSTQAALTEFLNSAQLSEQPKSPMFIDLKLELKNRTWYLVNGTSYLGKIDLIVHLNKPSINLCFIYLHMRVKQ